MAHQAFVQQFTEHILRAAAEMGAQAVGEQQSSTRGDTTGKYRIGGLGKTDGGEFRLRRILLTHLLTPVVIGGIIDACVMQVFHLLGADAS